MVDLSILSSYYASQRALSSPSLRAATTATAAAKSDVMPPWDVRVAQPSAAKRLHDALSLPLSVDLDDKTFDKEGVPEDHKKLFALYKALNVLSTLAGEAADDGAVLGQLAGLDRRFQRGMDTVGSFLSDLSLDSLTLLTGEKLSKVEASVRVPRATSSYTGAPAKTGAFADAVPGLTGNEVFTIQARKFGVDTNVTIDLSEISGPLNLDNIVAHINTKLADQGLFTRFKRLAMEHDENGIAKSFGLQIVGVSTEKITLSAASAAPSAYVVGASGTGAGADAQFIKLTDLDSDPKTKFKQTIDAGATSAATPKSTVVDGDGNVFVLGTTNGTIDTQSAKGEQDVFLRKYDSAGKLIWSKMLGASDQADAMGLSVTDDGGVVIAGKIRGKLTSTAIGGGGDSFVVKFNNDGEEEFVRQISPLVEDGAASVTVGSDGSIYVAGFTKTRLAGVTAHGGGADGFVTKLSDDGKVVYNRQFGGTGDERATNVAIANDGNVIVSSIEDGVAKLRKFASADGTSGAMWEKSLGAIQGGSLGQITVSGNDIYVAGSTSNASFNAGGQANIAQGHSGGQDGFVMKLVDGGSSVSADFVSYVGTNKLDRVTGVQVAGGEIYLTGETRGALPGETQSIAGASNGFVVKLGNTGTTEWSHQFAGAGGSATGAAIALDTSGSSVLDTLGLPRGRIDQDRSLHLTANSNVRAGESFLVSVNGKADRRIRIEDDETLRSLANKINSVLMLEGRASVKRVSGADVLRIEAKEGSTIDLKAGPDGFDALEGLGIAAGKIINDGSLSSDEEEDAKATAAKKDAIPIFGLGLQLNLKLLSKTDAMNAREVINGAMSEIRKAFREITRDPALDALAEEKAKFKGTVPAYMKAQLSNYQAALTRLQSGTPSSLYF